MTQREEQIIKIGIEIDRLLTDGIEIHPNSPIHEKLNQALQQPAIIKSKSKNKKEKEYDPEWFSKWSDVIKRI